MPGHAYCARFVFALFVAALFLLAPVAANAQITSVVPGGKSSEKSKISIPKDLTSAQVDALIAKLSDVQVRQILREYLYELTQARARAGKAAKMSLGERMEKEALKLEKRIPLMIAGLSEIPSVLGAAVARWQPKEGRYPILFLIFRIGFAVVVGLILEWLFRRATAKARKRVCALDLDAPFSTRLKSAFFAAGLETLALGSFFVGGIVVFLIFFRDSEATRLFMASFVRAYIIVRIVAIVSRFSLSPEEPALRLESVSDDGARFLHRRIVWICVFFAFSFRSADFLFAIGLKQPPYDLLITVFGTVVTILFIVMVAKSRSRLSVSSAQIPTVNEESSQSGRLISGQLGGAKYWIVIAYLALIWALWVYSILNESSLLRGSAILSLAIPAIAILLNRIFKRVLLARDARVRLRASATTEQNEESANSQDVEPSDPIIPGKLQGRYLIVLQRAFRIILVIGSLLLLLTVWNVDLFANMRQSMGASFAAALIDTALILLVVYVLWELVEALIRKKSAEEDAKAAAGHDAEEGGEGGGAPKTRLATLLPLFRFTLLTTLGVMSVMLTLSNLGVDIAPLLAGAGVVGLAIGFGAQTLVRDIVSGVFFLIDDAFRIGEYIEMGDLRGTVEKISIRSMRLRHHRGLVHTIPYGEVKSVTNYSRDWVIMKLEFRLPFGTDIDKVRKLIKQTGQEMMKEEFGKDMLAPLKSQGVLRMDESGMIFRAKFMTKPGEQFVVRREAYSRIQDVLRQNGIEFATSQVTVRVPELTERDDLTEQQKKGVVEAAGGAALKVTKSIEKPA